MSSRFIVIISIFLAVAVFTPVFVFAQENIQTTVAPMETVVQPAPLPTDAKLAPPLTEGQPIQAAPPPLPPPIQPQPPMEVKPMPPPFPEEEINRQDFIEPREIQDVLRQIRELKREAQRIIKRAAKANLTAEISQIRELVSQIAAIEAALRGPVDTISRDTLQDFYDSQMWETLNAIRIKIEMPREIKTIENDLKKLERLVNRKTFAVEGIDMATVKAKIDEIRTAVSQAKENLNQGNLEEAGESLRPIHEEGFYPGEMMGVLNRLSDITRQLKQIRSADIRNDIKEVLEPVYEAVNAGDFREANMLLNEIDRELWQIISTIKNKTTVNNATRARMDKLNEKLRQKSQGEENNELNMKEKRQSYYNYKNYSASLLEKFMDWFGLLDWLGL